MPVRIGDATPSGFRFGDLTATKIYLGDVLVFPAFTVVSQTFSTVGNWTFNIPAECGAIDIILLGGGGGGSSGNAGLGNGGGGDGGLWETLTLIRGIDFPSTALQITGTVGDGGNGGSGGWIPINGADGNPTTANIPGVGLVQALGGNGGNWTSGSRPGKGPGNRVHNGINYTGGANTGDSAANGNPPGGGAGGGNSGFFGFPAGGGGKGARGQAWVRAYV
ncbi:hypothetical protein SEA_DRUANTIA_5 [Mycobacterium phage Druantia]|uniref:Glycine-rich domain-containing protein n=1 Tax=Mycobacterium phage Druantia TaxID=2250327 RepID=A0A345L2Q8_9CAUD|nr:hypothetical protein SEA_DRUANTIA_5 [Mycobacterium phage Druantia]